MDEITAIKQFLGSHRVHISSEWLNDCIQWCKEEALPHNHSIKDLKEKVFEQWLLLDLRDVEVACLPPNLSLKQKFSLSGIYFLQILEILDISKPKYWQIQKIRNETPKNLENENINSKRMLLLTLTDGVQEIKAMELHSISSLNLNINPGVKIKLIGPMMIRRGTLLLEEHNIKVIGGEVDTILVSNAAENVLAKHLNLQLNPNPFRIQESMIATTDQLDLSDAHTQNNSGRQISNSQTINYVPNNQNPRNHSSVRHIKEISNCQNTKNNQKTYPISDEFDNMDNFFEDEDKINEEIEMIMELERSMGNSIKNTNQNTPDVFDDIEIDDVSFETIEIKDTTNEFNTRNQKLSHKVDVTDEDLKKSLEDGNDVFENLDTNISTGENNSDNSIQIKEDNKKKETQDCHAGMDNFNDDGGEYKNTEELTELKSPTQPKINIWPIERLNKNIANINNGKFKIKAKFKSIIEKLSVADEKFHLVVEVEDDSGSIILKFDDEIVSKLAGCTAENLMSLKSQVQENVLQAQARVLDVLKTLKDNLIKFNSLVVIIVNAREKFPILKTIL